MYQDITNYLGQPGMNWAFTLRRVAVDQYNEVKDQIESDAVNRILDYFGFSESFKKSLQNSDRSSYEGRDLQKFWLGIRSLAVSALSPGTSSVYRVGEKIQELAKTSGPVVGLNDEFMSPEDRQALQQVFMISQSDFAAAAKNIYAGLEEERKVRTQASTHVSRIRSIVDWLKDEESGTSIKYGEKPINSEREFTIWAVDVIEEFFRERENLIRYKASYVKIWLNHCADVFKLPVEDFSAHELETDLTTVGGTSWKTYKSNESSLMERDLESSFSNKFSVRPPEVIINQLSTRRISGPTEKVTMEISMKDDLVSARFVVPQPREMQIPMLQIELLNFLAKKSSSLNIQLNTESNSIVLSTQNKGAIAEFGSILLEALKLLNGES